MAQTTRTHGDFKQVMNMDSQSYTVGAIDAVTSAVTVQPQGPKLEFFTITGNGTTSSVGTYANAVIGTIQQLSTIYMYEYTTDTDPTLAIAVYPVGAWTTTELDTALTAAVTAAGGTGNIAVAASATFTN